MISLSAGQPAMLPLRGVHPPGGQSRLWSCSGEGGEDREGEVEEEGGCEPGECSSMGGLRGE